MPTHLRGIYYIITNRKISETYFSLRSNKGIEAAQIFKHTERRAKHNKVLLIL